MSKLEMIQQGNLGTQTGSTKILLKSLCNFLTGGNKILNGIDSADSIMECRARCALSYYFLNQTTEIIAPPLNHVPLSWFGFIGYEMQFPAKASRQYFPLFHFCYQGQFKDKY